MGRIVVYECEWCRRRAEPGKDGEYPDGWDDLEQYGYYDVLCRECAATGKRHLVAAFESARAECAVRGSAESAPEDSTGRA